jgi:hypothetical protein
MGFNLPAERSKAESRICDLVIFLPFPLDLRRWDDEVSSPILAQEILVVDVRSAS